jgi:hypothetical protein
VALDNHLQVCHGSHVHLQLKAVCTELRRRPPAPSLPPSRRLVVVHHTLYAEVVLEIMEGDKEDADLT